MSQVGRYVGGFPFVILPEGGVRITAVDPPSVEVEERQMHGLEVVDLTLISEGLPTNMGPIRQGADGRDCAPYLDIAYDPALNVDPGATGDPLDITEPCCLVKTVSRNEDEISTTASDTATLFRAPVFLIDHTPETDSLPPPLGSAPLVSRFVKTDIDFDLLPAVTLPGSAPSAADVLARFRWLRQMQMPNRSGGEWYTSYMAERHYASHSAAEFATACLLMCCDLSDYGSGLDEMLAIYAVIHGQNVLEAAKAGADFSWNSGLGGILAGHKLPLLVAGLLTGDEEMLEWADSQQHDIWAEDRQTLYVTQGHVDNYDYEPGDLGMPEWMQNPVKYPPANTRNPSAVYRNIFFVHCFGAAAVAHLLGGVNAWNHPPFFDYCERTARRTFFNGSGTTAYGFVTTGGFQPSLFHRDMYTAHVPSGWDWPP